MTKVFKNKKDLAALIIIILYPYAYLAQNMIAAQLRPGEQTMNLISLVESAIRLIALITAAFAAMRGTTVKQVAIVKLAHIPAYIIPVAGMIMHGFIEEIPLVMMLNITTLFISGIYMLGIYRIETRYKLMGFIYVLDIVAVVQLLSADMRRISSEM